MKHIVSLFITLLFVALPSMAQTTDTALPTSLEEWSERLGKFGSSIPQEEVYIHTDNTSYYLGDTIFYQAYVVRSDGKPTNLSGLLYVELLNQDGFLVKRQKVKIEHGQGSGSIELLDTLYGGYYELRAYTRWQLNWGQFEHPHTKIAERWFYSKKMAKEYYRDYDKLYSRVFPVFDKPKEAGDYIEEMTVRPLRRHFKEDQTKEKTQVTLYPEGGHLIAGVPCRVAFDATDETGLHLDGVLKVLDKSGAVVTTARTEHRGRGSFTLTPTTEKYTFTFEAEKRSAKGKLPEAETDGCTILASVEEDGIHVKLQSSGQASTEPLGLTAMCHGLKLDFQQFAPSREASAVIPMDLLRTGVVQLDVFNASGRIYADRLVFVRKPDFQPSNISFTGLKDKQLKAYEEVEMGIKSLPLSTVSVAVRDAAHSEFLYDSGNILTEMLLASQIKGFVEAPEYYFESNDEAHRRALDLLLMVQGWRRYNWVEMATPKAFALSFMPEKTELLTGEVLRYTAEEQENLFANAANLAADEAGMSAEYDEFANSEYGDYASPEMVRKWKGAKAAMFAAKVLKNEMGISPEDYKPSVTDPNDYYIEMRMLQRYAKEADEKRALKDSQKMSGDVATTRFNENEGNLKREVCVHAEFVQPAANGSKGDGVVGDMMTSNRGSFQINAPGFYDHVYFFLGASDSTKWKKNRTYNWVEHNEDKNDELVYPEFYVRLSPIFPRFVKPYNAYQTQLRELPEGSPINVREEGVYNLREVTVRVRRNGLSGFNPNKPAFVIDAYEAFNNVCDAGFCPGYFIGSGRFATDVARTYIGDMNMERPYDLEPRFEAHPLSRFNSPGVLQNYSHLNRLDKVYIYTDYSPRREGDRHFAQDDQPIVTVDLREIPLNGRRVAYRDRRYILSGYSVCEDFYNPDYSKAALPYPKDYRRTIYWNPALTLDEAGEAKVKFYNNGKHTIISVSADGLGTNGELLTGQE